MVYQLVSYFNPEFYSGWNPAVTVVVADTGAVERAGTTLFLQVQDRRSYVGIGLKQLVFSTSTSEVYTN